MLIYLIFDPDQGGLPFISKEVEYSYDPRKAFPTYLTTENWKILKTLSFWLKLAAIYMKESAKPFLKFDELNIAIISAWNFLVNMLGDNLNMAIGDFLIQLPWMLYLWSVFDGDFSKQEMFKSASEYPYY